VLLTVLALTLVAVALALPAAGRELSAVRRRRSKNAKRRESGMRADPGRERRAEQRARELLRSCVNDEEWAMYRDLGFIRVRGATPGYAYLVYPHKPVVAYMPESGRLLNEYCVEFPDLSGTIGGSRLPDSDDVLAKWMALTGDERRLIRTANMHLPGRQVDPGRVRRDLWRLAQWERERSSARS
jgi:hypothetical protein